MSRLNLKIQISPTGKLVKDYGVIVSFTSQINMNRILGACTVQIIS